MSKSAMPRTVSVYSKAENTSCKGKWSFSDTMAEGGMVIRLAEKIRRDILMQRIGRFLVCESTGAYMRK